MGLREAQEGFQGHDPPAEVFVHYPGGQGPAWLLCPTGFRGIPWLRVGINREVTRMTGATWTGETERAAAAYFRRFQSLAELQTVWQPWDELVVAVKAFLNVEALRSLPATEVYSRVVGLFEGRPRIRGRFKSLLAFHDGERLREALIRLVTTRERGDPGRRIDAMGLGGVGRATASELLCLWWPYRFLPQNAASCGAMAKLVQLYRKKDLAELPYDVFMDLAGTLEEAFRGQAVAAWPGVAGAVQEGRFLYFYAFLSDR